MRYTILVIEDNHIVCANIASILELANYKVLTANNGKDGVAQALHAKPDLILCDIMMPELDGYGVLHILSNNVETSGIPFIFLTAKTEKEDFRTGMNLGADDYITKPFEAAELLKVIETRMKRHDLLRASFGNDIQDINELFDQARQHNVFDKISSSLDKRIIKNKDFLYMEGENPKEVYFIHKGELKTYVTSSEGKELITGIHKQGDFAGYVPLLENTPYHETAIAMKDSEVFLIPKEDFTKLIFSNKGIARKFIKLLSNSVSETETRLLNMAYQSVRQRVAGTLLKINSPLGPEKGQESIVLSRRDISSLVGTATETLNRTLADFKDEGLIELTEHGIRLLDRRKLERLSR